MTPISRNTETTEYKLEEDQNWWLVNELKTSFSKMNETNFKNHQKNLI